MLRIITDSAADITLAEARKWKVTVIPLSITFSDGICPQETEEDFAEFYRRLSACQQLPTTSQPAPDMYLSAFEEAKAAGDDVLVLALSGGLSGTVRSAAAAKALSGYDRITVVDTHQAIIAQRILVEEAVLLRDAGLDGAAIAQKIEAMRDYVTVSGVVDTLENLRKGGRIPPSLAILGTALKIKPVIALQGTILQTIGKAMGRKAGIRMLYERLEKYPPNPAYPIYFGYSSNRALGEQFLNETVEKFSLQSFRTELHTVGGVIGTHVGDNCLAICYVAQEPIV